MATIRCSHAPSPAPSIAAGKGMGFTGVDDPYEPPLKPEITLHNDKLTPQEAAAQVLTLLEEKGLLPRQEK